jgi:hypothetical protein
VPLIKNIQGYISELEGINKISSNSATAIAKLRLAFSRRTALDNFLGALAKQLQVLEYRSAVLISGL